MTPRECSGCGHPACNGQPGDCPTASQGAPLCVHCDGELTRDMDDNGTFYYCAPCDCEHDETDHGICIDCGKDCTSDLAGEAEFAAEARAGR